VEVDMGINWLAAVPYVIDKIPFEKLLTHPRDRAEEMKELKEILKANPPKKVEVTPNASTTSKVTTKETVDYQNREMGKVLIQMERHAAQGLKIAGKPCDCLSKHLVDLEALAEETITMVSNPGIYMQIIDWVREIAPKTTVEANESGLYVQEYPVMARQARDFRKELLGTLDYKELFRDKAPIRERTTTFDDIPEIWRQELPEDKTNKKMEKATELEIPAELAREPVAEPVAELPEILTETTKNIPVSDNEAKTAKEPNLIPKNIDNAEVKYTCLPDKMLIRVSTIVEERDTHGQVYAYVNGCDKPKSSWRYLPPDAYLYWSTRAAREMGKGEDIAKILDTVVAETLRRRGIGTLLVQEAVKTMQEYGIKGIVGVDTSGTDFWDKQGFLPQTVIDSLVNPVSDQEDEPPPQLAANGTVCPELKSMTEWAAGEDTAICRECMLTITIPWYFEELEALGDKELVDDLEKIQKEGDPLKVAAALDQIKEQVSPEVKQRLLEFDCASQSFEM
jgi:predicted GNAT family acetyltransferase